MALSATMYRFQISLSDVERGVYTELDLRLARHPSESFRYLATRTLAYCLEYEDGIRFSKGGLSDSDEPAVVTEDPTGARLNCIEIGSPSAERLHKASKASPRVVLYSSAERALLRKEAASRAIHRLDEIGLYWLSPAFLDGLESSLGRNVSLEILRNDGMLYVTIAGRTHECPLERETLLES